MGKKANKEDKIDERKPVINGRASVVTSSITITVLWKKQLTKLIHWLIENDYSFGWSVTDLFQQNTKYHLTIDEVIWANNLVEIAGILEKCDYQEP
jgi:hypothetical protein